jgi:hypothetical protein
LDSSTGQLTFATEPDDTKAHYQGLLFRWGSLIGASPSSNSAAPYITFRPNEYTTTINAWTDIPYASDGNSDSPSLDQFITTYPVLGYDATTGKGDICRYISDKGWVSGHWRMPTGSEFEALPTGGNITTVGTSWSAVGGTDVNGVTVIPQGKFFEGKLRFCPPSGTRATADGSLTDVGVKGYYWSSSPQSGSSSHSVSFGETSLMFNGVDKGNAFSIRCIRDTIPRIAVSPSNYTFPASGGSQDFDVYTANLTGSWVVRKTGDSSDSKASWLTVTPNGNKLTMVAASNATTTAHTATVTVTTAGAEDVTVAITQAAAPPSLSVSPMELSVSAGTSTNNVSTVSTNVSTGWTATTTDAWISLTKASGGDGEQVTFNVISANPTMATRTGYIALKATGVSDITLPVVQAGAPASLSVSPTRYNFDVGGGSYNFTVATNVTSGYTFGVIDGSTWLSCSANGNILTVTTNQNTNLSNRSTTVYISAEGTTNVILTITQNGNPLPSGTMAYSNIYRDSSTGHLTFATKPDDTKSHYHGMLFKFGSLYGFSPNQNDTWNNNIFVPVGGSVPSNYSDVQYYNPYDGKEDIALYYDESTGLGDICQYISAKGWVDGNWRMPDFSVTFMDTVVVSVVGTLEAPTSAINSDGTTVMNSGWQFTNLARFLPMAGVRSTNSFSFYGYGCTYYRESSNDSDATTWVLSLNPDSDDFRYVIKMASAYKSYALPIRCVAK